MLASDTTTFAQLFATADRLKTGASQDFTDMLRLVCGFLGVESGAVLRLTDEGFEIEHECGHGPPEVADAHMRFGREVLDTQDVLSVDPDGVDTTGEQEAPIHSYVGAPLTVEGEVYGTVGFVSSEPRELDWAERDRALIRMLARWIESSYQLQHAASRHDKTLIELDIATRALAQRNEELELFSAAASHDLRSPLRRVQMLLDFARDDHSDMEPALLERLDQIAAVVAEADLVTQEFLGYARASSARIGTDPVDLGRVLAAIQAARGPAIEEAGGRLCVGPLPKVRGNSSLLRQLFDNLVGNAVKYRHAVRPPQVTVEARQATPGFVEVHVRDNGRGLDPADLPRLLRPFERSKSVRAQDGVGMGLAIADRIARSHGGGVDATSEPGEGTTFVVTLPAG